MKKIGIILFILVLIVIISLYRRNLILKNYKDKIQKTASIEIYLLDKEDFTFLTSISDANSIKEFTNILSSIYFKANTNKPMMTQIPNYKLLLYDDKSKRIMEIKCIPGLVIEGYKKNDIDIKKYNSLKKILNSLND